MPKREDITGKVFGRLTAICFVELRPIGKCRRTIWKFRCECGTVTEKQIESVKKGGTRSCGCLHHDSVYKHGGGAEHRSEYQSWHGMIQRCRNPSIHNYHRYGGRGIEICNRWSGKRGFLNFLSDMGKRPKGMTLDRKDNDGNYTPKNCQWATRRQQARNRITSRLLKINRETLTVAEWSERTGITHNAITDRLKRGWSEHDAVFTPSKGPSKKPPRIIEYAGKSQSLTEWARETGLFRTTIANRIDLYGWTIQDALSVKV